MKKIYRILLITLMIFCVFTNSSCKNKKTTTEADNTTTIKTNTKEYRVEYYFETENGYVLDDTKTKILTGDVDKTVTHPREEFDGYVYESSHKSNVVRGRVKEDGSLVLKAYYSYDYTGRIAFQSDLDKIDLIKGESTKLNVKVLLDNKEVTDGVLYESSYKAVTIDENGMMEGRMRGEAEISVSYKNISKSFVATVYDAFIENEEDWWGIYEHLSYWYKFSNDVVLSESSVEHFTIPESEDQEKVDGFLYNPQFTGVIDGDGHSLTYTGSRLFNWLSGGAIIRNLVINASDGFYWGSTIAYGMSELSLVENVTLNAMFTTQSCFRAVNKDFWIQLGGDNGVYGTGGMFGLIENSTVENCTINLDISRLESGENFGAVCYDAKPNTAIRNCKIITTYENMAVVKVDSGATIITDNTVSLLKECDYTIEHYLENNGVYNKNDELTQHLKGFTDRLVNASPLSINGYAFDTENTLNVLDGKIKEDGSLVLKVYYKKSNVRFESELPSHFDASKGDEYQLEFSIYLENQLVESGYTVTSSDPSILSVDENNKVTVLKSGYAKVVVEYQNATMTFEFDCITGLIKTEEDWWKIFDDLTGYYKLSNDIYLTDNVCNHFGENSYMINHTFSGVLDGDGHTLSYTGNKLFTSVEGTIKNIHLSAGSGYYWGSAIAYFLSDAKLENITLDATIDRYNTYWYAADMFIEAPGSGALAVWVTTTKFKNIVINLMLTDECNLDYYVGVAHSVLNSSFDNVTINCNKEVRVMNEGNTEYDNVTVNNSSKTYKIEYYKDGVKDDSLTQELNGTMGFTVSVTPTTIIGYTFDEDNTNNVLSGTVKEDGSLVLKLYYKTSVTELSTEEDWWSIYSSDISLQGTYILKNDIVLTKTVADQEEYMVNYEFSGEIDGNGYSITYSSNKLFTTFSGTLKNITLNAGNGYYWGSALAYFVSNAKVSDVTVNATFSRNNTYWYAPNVGYIEAPGSGALGVWIENSSFSDLTINVELTGDARKTYYASIGYSVNTSTIDNVVVNSHTNLDSIKIGDSDVSQVVFNLIEDPIEYTLIENEEDFWNIYKDSTSLSGNYKLANDITLTKNTGEGNGYQVNHQFNGIINGDGHTLNYSGARLFNTFSGTLKNITLNAGDGYYWGSALSYFLSNAIIENVTISVNFSRSNTYWYANGYIEAPGSGALAVWADGVTIDGLVINYELSNDATTQYYAAIAYELKNSTLSNITINTKVDLDVIKTGNSDVSQVIINKLD